MANKGEKVLGLVIYFMMLIFGGIAVLMTDVFTPIFGLSDPFTTIIMFLFCIGLFFVGIPYIIWNARED